MPAQPTRQVRRRREVRPVDAITGAVVRRPIDLAPARIGDGRERLTAHRVIDSDGVKRARAVHRYAQRVARRGCRHDPHPKPSEGTGTKAYSDDRQIGRGDLGLTENGIDEGRKHFTVRIVRLVVPPAQYPFVIDEDNGHHRCRRVDAESKHARRA